MRKLSFLLFVILSVLFQSCAFHYGALSDSASLSYPNFTIVRSNIQGSAKTLKVVGLGGLARNAIVADAKKNLLAKYPLKENQALANVSVDFKTSLLFIVQTKTCIVTADIVEFK
ncbi:DUF6567 family protein [Larkinella bovis]|uniref:DUF6567 family protein n=1 Tax=Larkinella bovis TaxID=683041 RepID=A0ABW0II46_9BACT